MEYHTAAAQFVQKCFNDIFRIPCKADIDCPYSLRCNMRVCRTYDDLVIDVLVECLDDLMVSNPNI